VSDAPELKDERSRGYAFGQKALRNLKAMVPAKRNASSCETCIHGPIPQTSRERQQQAIHDKRLDVDVLLREDASRADAIKRSLKENTVLYLAYGANMCSETFRKKRGIVPISRVNVYVPDLSLNFDLAGIPYIEPCFAATQYRDRGTGLQQPSQSPSPVRLAKDPAESPLLPLDVKEVWGKPLVGVVYEVFLSDYAHIIATEGGGASYVDIVVDCYPFPTSYNPSQPVPDFPDTTPFKTHTLFLPSGNNDKNGKVSAKYRANAQPSRRYLNLLIAGAEEHDLPYSYRTYLSSIRYYHITTFRQRIGQLLFCTLWFPLVITLVLLGTVFSDERGRHPPWLVKFSKGFFRMMWLSYDAVFKRVFGDGEKTIGDI
jgi:hypothetical protein